MYKLNNGVEMPEIGFGVYQIPDFDECKRSVLDALEVGYRLIDTAQAYGNEEAVGAAIKESGLKRDEVFVTTKLWISHYGEEKAQIALNESLEKLELEFIDLYLLHQPYGDVHGAWRTMEKNLEGGKLRAIGVSNFHNDRVMDLIKNNKIAPAVNQIECNPFHQRNEEHPFLKKLGIQMESWAPFAEGRSDFFTNNVLMKIGEKYNKSVAQVTLRWMIQRGIVVIPKSVNRERIEQNFNVFDFELSDQDLEMITHLNRSTSELFDHRDPAIIEMLYNLHT